MTTLGPPTCWRFCGGTACHLLMDCMICNEDETHRTLPNPSAVSLNAKPMLNLHKLPTCRDSSRPAGRTTFDTSVELQ